MKATNNSAEFRKLRSILPLVAIALANKMARSIWAMLTKAEDYRVPVVATP